MLRVEPFLTAWSFAFFNHHHHIHAMNAIRQVQQLNKRELENAM